MANDGGDSLVGSLGYVTTRIRGGDAPGEAQVSFRGISEPFIAYSDEPIETGSRILVVGRRPGRVVDVMVFAG